MEDELEEWGESEGVCEASAKRTGSRSQSGNDMVINEPVSGACLEEAIVSEVDWKVRDEESDEKVSEQDRKSEVS